MGGSEWGVQKIHSLAYNVQSVDFVENKKLFVSVAPNKEQSVFLGVPLTRVQLSLAAIKAVQTDL